MIRKTLAATTLALTTLAALPAAADIITKMSPHSVPDTIDRLETAVTEAGATVFARVDHAEGATKVDMELRPTTLLIFGNPKLGTPAMLDGQTAGLDLPMRVLAYADDSGMVHVSRRHRHSERGSRHSLVARGSFGRTTILTD